ncbi:IS66-like element accessory protein TnpA [Pseudomonas moorei]|uniref:IS66-like element accessory protein TnpA n=1 Tax=Pseudomonas moorei TaxID=395599 RepID=UPI000B7DEEAD|nr:transposase [Pseudomonas moorei]KAB0508987.1 transposase [Pseudomonas moorei]
MRQRTSYPKPFKTQIVQECLQPGVSMASVALRHGINANLVRKWIPAYRDRQAPALPAFVPMKLAPARKSGAISESTARLDVDPARSCAQRIGNGQSLGLQP